MNDKNAPSRGLEKVCHYFLTGGAPSSPESDTSDSNRIAREIVPFPKSSMQRHPVEYGLLENTVAQLYVLRNSCKGMYHSQSPDDDTVWFEGAAAILQDVITDLMATLRSIDNK